MAMEIAMKQIGTTPVMEVTGKISDVDVEVFSAAVQKMLAEGHPRMVLDISKVNFVDSQGLGKIVSFSATSRKDNRELIILNANTDPNSFVAGLFAMTNLNKVLNVASSLDGMQL